MKICQTETAVEEKAVISLYSIYWTECALVFVPVMSFLLFMSLFSRWNVPFLNFCQSVVARLRGQQGLDSLFIISVANANSLRRSWIC